jgi:hypothetical protein
MRALLALALIVGFSFVLVLALLAILVEFFPPRQPFDEHSDDLWIGIDGRSKDRHAPFSQRRIVSGNSDSRLLLFPDADGAGPNRGDSSSAWSLRCFLNRRGVFRRRAARSRRANGPNNTARSHIGP